MPLKFKRISLKLSGEAMGGEHESVNFAAANRLAQDVKSLVEAGVSVGITVGGGNIWRGRSSADMDRNKADQMGMLATTINALAIEAALKTAGVPVKVLSALSMEKICDLFTSERAEAAFMRGEVVVFAAGTGHPGFTTDTAAALKAVEINADALLLAKNVDAVYSADPKKDASAVRYSNLTYDEVLEKDLRATDLTAITLCKDNNIPILVFAMSEEGSILNACRGESIGTLIS